MSALGQIQGVFSGARGKALAAVLAAPVAFGLAAQAEPANAQQAKPVNYITEEGTPYNFAAQQLKQYSKETGGIGIMVSYHPWENGLTREEVIAKLKGFFKEYDGTQADVKIIENDVPGIAVSYVVQDVIMGPYNPAEAKNAVPQIAEMNKFARNPDKLSQLELEQ